MERPNCVLLTRAEQLAREKELIKKNSNLNCPFSLMCYGIVCFFSKLETTRLLLIHQDESVDNYSPKEKFFNRLKKTVSKIKKSVDGSSPKNKFYERLEKHFQAKKGIN